MPTLLLFASIREAAGTPRATVDGDTVGAALKDATERYGDRFAAILDHCSVLVADEQVERTTWWDRPVSPADEIAVLPPVSGGADETRMIDVGDKDETKRAATAMCLLRFTDAAARDELLAGAGPKGDAVGPATVAAMLAAKRTPELLPHCHPVRLTSIDPLIVAAGVDAIEIRVTVRGRDRTGFEMEALTACSIAALTLYDVGKATDPRMQIEGLRIVAKSGGTSGDVTYP